MRVPAGRVTPGAPRPCLAAGAARGFPLGGSRGKGAVLGPLSQGSILLGLGLGVVAEEWGFFSSQGPLGWGCCSQGGALDGSGRAAGWAAKPHRNGIWPLQALVMDKRGKDATSHAWSDHHSCETTSSSPQRGGEHLVQGRVRPHHRALQNPTFGINTLPCLGAPWQSQDSSWMSPQLRGGGFKPGSGLQK